MKKGETDGRTNRGQTKGMSGLKGLCWGLKGIGADHLASVFESDTALSGVPF